MQPLCRKRRCGGYLASDGIPGSCTEKSLEVCCLEVAEAVAAVRTEFAVLPSSFVAASLGPGKALSMDSVPG
jgi:hypothetical protein